jgi:hypothetical protein
MVDSREAFQMTNRMTPASWIDSSLRIQLNRCKIWVVSPHQLLLAPGDMMRCCPFLLASRLPHSELHLVRLKPRQNPKLEILHMEEPSSHAQYFRIRVLLRIRLCSTLAYKEGRCRPKSRMELRWIEKTMLWRPLSPKISLRFLSSSPSRCQSSVDKAIWWLAWSLHWR